MFYAFKGAVGAQNAVVQVQWLKREARAEFQIRV
jgi:hypothetical protein